MSVHNGRSTATGVTVAGLLVLGALVPALRRAPLLILAFAVMAVLLQA